MKNLLKINLFLFTSSSKKLIFVFILLLLLPFTGCKSVVKVSGYTSHYASATSNLFVLKEVTSEFSEGDIVTFGDSKKEYEIREVKVLKKSESGNIQGIVLYKGNEFKISPGSGNIQGIVINRECWIQNISRDESFSC